MECSHLQAESGKGEKTASSYSYQESNFAGQELSKPRDTHLQIV